MPIIKVDYGELSGSEVENYEVVTESTSSTGTLTITGKSGKTLLVLLYTWSSATVPYNRYDNATITGGTLTKLTNATTSNVYTSGTWFVVNVISNECVISHSVVFAYKVFEAIGKVIPSQQQVKTGIFTTNTTDTAGYKVTLGFKPKYICIIRNTTQAAYNMIYNKDLDSTKYNRGTASANAWRSFEAVSPYSIKSIDDDGFIVYTASGYNSTEWRYFAISE